VTKPAKVLGKGIAILELGSGGLAYGTARAAVAPSIEQKMGWPPAVTDGLLTVGGLVVAGLSRNQHIDNLATGFASAGASRLAETLYNWLKSKLPQNSTSGQEESISQAQSQPAPATATVLRLV